MQLIKTLNRCFSMDMYAHDPEVQEWCYRMMHDPEEWEKFRYIDAIHDYKNIIANSRMFYYCNVKFFYSGLLNMHENRPAMA